MAATMVAVMVASLAASTADLTVAWKAANYIGPRAAKTAVWKVERWVDQ